MLHHWEDCDLEITDLGVLESYEHQDKDKNLLVHAHIVPIDTASKQASSSRSAAGKPTTSSASTRPSRDPSKKQSLSLRSKKTAPSSKKPKQDPAPDPDPEDNESEESEKEADQESYDADKINYIRIGQYFDQDEDETSVVASPENEVLERQSIVIHDKIIVADVSKIKTKGVEFLIVDSWVVNELRIGYCHYGREWDIEGKSSYELDAPFRDCWGDIPKLRERLRGIAKGTRANNSLKLPVGGEYPKGKPTGLTRSTRDERVNVVVLFGLVKGLDLPINLQADFTPKTTLAEFRQYVLKGDKLEENGNQHYPGLEKIAGGKDLGDWTMQVWVLPQVQKSRDMYGWDKKEFKDWRIDRWLDDDLREEKKYKRMIYVEVDIYPGETEAEQDEEEVEETVSKGRKAAKGKKGTAKIKTRGKDA